MTLTDLVNTLGFDRLERISNSHRAAFEYDFHVNQDDIVRVLYPSTRASSSILLSEGYDVCNAIATFTKSTGKHALAALSHYTPGYHQNGSDDFRSARKALTDGGQQPKTTVLIGGEPKRFLKNLRTVRFAGMDVPSAYLDFVTYSTPHIRGKEKMNAYEKDVLLLNHPQQVFVKSEIFGVAQIYPTKTNEPTLFVPDRSDEFLKRQLSLLLTI